MPRSIQEILDHGDELARRFEDYEPTSDDERPVEEYLLERDDRPSARGASGRRRRRCGSQQGRVVAADRRHPRHLSPGGTAAVRHRCRIHLRSLDRASKPEP